MSDKPTFLVSGRRMCFVISMFMLALSGMLLAAELLCRIKLYLDSKNAWYLMAPLGKSESQQVEYSFDVMEFNTNVEDSYYFKFNPGTYRPPPPYDYGLFSINSHGFRGKEFSLFNKGGKVRIFCIGESSTFGAESPDEMTWPARLEYYLNKRAENRFEVVNGGFPAAASSTYKNLIRFELVNYQPDIFIIYAGANEMILDRNIRKRKDNKLVDYLHSRLYYKSMLYTLLTEKISFLLTRSPAPMNVYTSDPEDVFARNIKEIIKTCRDNNIRLFFVRQMYWSTKDLFMKDDLSRKEIKSALRFTRKGGWITEDKIYNFNRIMRTMARLASEHNIPLLDLRNDFYKSLEEDDKILYYDYIHLTPQGNDRLAELMSRIVSELLPQPQQRTIRQGIGGE